MDENGGDSHSFQSLREIWCSKIFIIPPETHLGGDRNLHGVHHSFDELRGLVEFGHHRRAAPDFAHFLHRTTHVDIHRRNADRFQVNGSIAHFFRNRSEQLHGQRSVRRGGLDELERFRILFQQRTGVNEICGRQIQSAQLPKREPKRQVRITRERREKQIRFQIERAELHRANS